MSRDKAFLRHILDEVKFLNNQFKGLELHELMEDEVLKRACVRSLEVIGRPSRTYPKPSREGIPRLSGGRSLA